MRTDRIEVGVKPELADPAGTSLVARLRDDLGIHVSDARVFDVYTLRGDFTEYELERARVELFTDPVLQVSALNRHLATEWDAVVEVGFLPGVTDNVGKSALEGLRDLLGRDLGPDARVFKSTLYAFRGIDRDTADRVAGAALGNPLIEQWRTLDRDELLRSGGRPLLALPLVHIPAAATAETLSLNLDDAALMALSRDRMLALDLREMRAIREHYADPATRARRAALGMPADPTDVEIECIAQTWSEHCKHKIFSARIHYTAPDGSTREIDGLFRTYIRGATEAVAPTVDWLVSVFEDNAGIIRFDDNHLFALKCETHNSPSALDPYGGAMTGIVGVNRDVLGAGLGFQCIFNTDVFCFASPFYEGELPPRLLHPRRVLRGVHAGVRDGGNQSGIPDINGAIVFHERFLGKPLVFCGTGGLAPATAAGRPTHEKAASPGDLIVMTGGRIGKDGIHGATFSSEELHEGSPATAVQIGDPITQKKMADFLLEARDLGLFTCITDNGAGGLSSSVGEMARKPGGAVLHLDRAPLKYPGLAPWEIFLSEAQERMTLAVPPEHIDAFLELAKRREVEATVLGEFTDTGLLECFYGGQRVAALDMTFLHEGLPRMELEARLDPQPPAGTVEIVSDDLGADLKQVLAALNVCSKESFVRMYDCEVLAQSVLKQFQGELQDGPGDAAVIKPVADSWRGLAVACGIAPKYADLDAASMMACAVDEAVRNLVCVGTGLGRIAGLDNFCWPDPVQSEKTPDGRHKLAQLVIACETLYDLCVAYGIPLISGKDSMKNDYKLGDIKISIPPTVLFTAAGIVEDVRRCVSMDVKRPGDLVFVLGETRDEMGGSEYFLVKGLRGGVPPRVHPLSFRRLYEQLHKAMMAGLVASCHDCSDGGLGVALAESAFAGGFGMKLDFTRLPEMPENPAVILFSESQGRFVVTVQADHFPAFKAMMDGLPCTFLGVVTEEPWLDMAFPGDLQVREDIDALRTAWKQTLNW